MTDEEAELMGHDAAEDMAFGSSRPGMSLRDWFAGQALPAVFNQHPVDRGNAEKVALRCYRLADAMLAARKEGDDDET